VTFSLTRAERVDGRWRARGFRALLCARCSERIRSHKIEAKFSEQSCGKSTLQFPIRIEQLHSFVQSEEKNGRSIREDAQNFLLCTFALPISSLNSGESSGGIMSRAFARKSLRGTNSLMMIEGRKLSIG
jgi:hypothetical protein